MLHSTNKPERRVTPQAVGACCLAFASLSFVGCGESKEYRIDPETHTVRTEIPIAFTAQAKTLSVGTVIVLKDDKGEFGKIEERVLNFGRTFEYLDASKQVKAKAHQRAFSLGTKIDISDEEGKAIGSVEENVFKSFFKIITSYSIKDSLGNIIGESDKNDWAGTHFIIKDKQGNPVVKMDRPFIDFGAATWNIEISGNANFDKRLVLFITAFKTAADNSSE